MVYVLLISIHVCWDLYWNMRFTFTRSQHRCSIQDINTVPHYLASVGNNLLPELLHLAYLQKEYYINNNAKFCCQLKTWPGPLSPKWQWPLNTFLDKPGKTLSYTALIDNKTWDKCPQPGATSVMSANLSKALPGRNQFSSIWVYGKVLYLSYNSHQIPMSKWLSSPLSLDKTIQSFTENISFTFRVQWMWSQSIFLAFF